MLASGRHVVSARLHRSDGWLMQRSVRPFLIPELPLGRHARRIGAAVGVAALLLAVGAGPALAHGDRGGRGGQHWSQQNRQTTTLPTTQPQATGAYVYVKNDALEPASWENSTQQYLVATWPGASYRDLTFDEVRAAVPAGVAVCGTGWAVQEDQVNGTEAVFTDHKAPSYPNDYIGWGPIFAAQHSELSAMVTVPACGVVAPAEPTPTLSATPTPTPTVSTTPTPTATQVAAPTPTATPTAEVGPTSNPSPTATETRSAEAVAAAVASPSPSESFYSEVLAAGGDGSAVLAATGSSVGPVVLAGAVLVLAGAALLVLRRRRAA